MTGEQMAEAEKTLVGANANGLHDFDYYPDTRQQAEQIVSAVASLHRDAKAAAGAFFDDERNEQFFNVRCEVPITERTWMNIHAAMHKIAEDAGCELPNCGPYAGRIIPH